MPIYEFTCSDCQASFEELLSSPAACEKVRCAQCGSARVQRTLSLFGFAAKDRSGATVRSSSSGKNCSGCHSHHCGQCH